MRRTSVERSIGCAAITPAAFIGLAGLADGIGPRGWLGFSEFLGWAAVCVASSLMIAAMLAQARHKGWVGFVAIAVAIAGAVSFAFLLSWLGLDAPRWAKRAFTSSLQVVGTVAPIALVSYIAFAYWSARRRG